MNLEGFMLELVTFLMKCYFSITKIVNIVNSQYLLYTVKPVYNDHSRETQKAVVVHRWSLFTGSLNTIIVQLEF